ncbi:MAG: right-handed parallel beta-helix repeat-containing protein [Thermoplasmata archaeon]|nr:MAG: right-handed parallel beta-helix repeat-containing protein [Thermoplasmata archaeon]
MGRKVITIWLSLVMVSSLIMIVDITIDFSLKVEGTTLYVNKTGSGGAYTIIQDAMDAAKAGDTVYVFSGTYTENVVINKTINLTGENRDNTIIERKMGFDQFVVYVNASFVNLTGFTITDSGANDAGLRLENSENCRIFDNNIISNNGEGIYLERSSNNSIINNYVSNNGILASDACGIYLSMSSNDNLVANNDISDNDYGIYIYSSINNNLSNNRFINDGIFIWGDQLPHFDTHTIPENNVIKGRPVYYYKNFNNINFDGVSFGEIILVNCTNFTIKNSQITDTDVGIEVAYSSNGSIEDNNISSMGMYGIFLDSTFYVNISGNRISNTNTGILPISSSHINITHNYINWSYEFGMYLGSSTFNLIAYNYINSSNIYGIALYWSSHDSIIKNNEILNTDFGIYLSRSSNSSILENFMVNNDYSIGLSTSSNSNITSNEIYESDDYGISFWDSSNNTIANNYVFKNNIGINLNTLSNNNTIIWNNISNNNRGIYLLEQFSRSPKNNTIINNNVFSNSNYGFYIGGAINNKIYHNNIIENTNQAYDSSDNLWDNGYPSGGNYWSDFDEPNEGAYDDYNGPNQDILGKDGKVDNGTLGGGGLNPYVIDSDSQDNYPLITSVGNYSYLHHGRNLISIPFIQSDTKLGNVLSSIAGSYTAVQWYNTTEPDDHWKHYRISKPPQLNDLEDIDHNMGFWIYITKPGGVLIQYLGTQPTQNQTISLHPGWNLVGYPSLTNYNRTVGLNNLTFGQEVDIIQWYNTSSQTWHDMEEDDYFMLGRGYWVYAKTECIWEVPL